MERNVSMEEISDGKLYELNDMVKAGCGDCDGCSACCRGMGTSIVLDPCDIFRMSAELGLTFQELMNGKIELNVVDGMILPNLAMESETESCAFLNEEGRCSIHPYRPGICRLFPLGRFYENGGFRYFLQTKECKKENRTKVKVKMWIDTPQVKRYEEFISCWHYFLKSLQLSMKESENAEVERNMNLYILKSFYMTPYETDHSFYDQFEERYMKASRFAEEAGLQIAEI